MFFLALLVVFVVVFVALVIWANRRAAPPPVRQRIVGPLESSSASPLSRSQGKGFTAEEAQRLRAEVGGSRPTSTSVPPSPESKIQAEIASLRRLSESIKSTPPAPVKRLSGRIKEEIASLHRISARALSPKPPEVKPWTFLPDKDAWEDWTSGAYDPYRQGHEIKVQVELYYRDANGQETKRRIDLERYVHDDRDGIFHAYCHLREQRRSFRFSRVLGAIDSKTGEVITDLASWLDVQYEQSDAGKADCFMREHDDALAALFYVAKSDGAFRQPEKTVVMEFCSAQGCSVPSAVVDEVAQWEVPSAIGYGKAIRAVAAKDVAYQRRVLAAAETMSKLKKTVRDAEVKAIERMRKAFASS